MEKIRNNNEMSSNGYYPPFSLKTLKSKALLWFWFFFLLVTPAFMKACIPIFGGCGSTWIKQFWPILSTGPLLFLIVSPLSLLIHLVWTYLFSVLVFYLISKYNIKKKLFWKWAIIIMVIYTVIVSFMMPAYWAYHTIDYSKKINLALENKDISICDKIIDYKEETTAYCRDRVSREILAGSIIHVNVTGNGPNFKICWENREDGKAFTCNLIDPYYISNSYDLYNLSVGPGEYKLIFVDDNLIYRTSKACNITLNDYICEINVDLDEEFPYYMDRAFLYSSGDYSPEYVANVSCEDQSKVLEKSYIESKGLYRYLFYVNLSERSWYDYKNSGNIMDTVLFVESFNHCQVKFQGSIDVDFFEPIYPRKQGNMTWYYSKEEEIVRIYPLPGFPYNTN